MGFTKENYGLNVSLHGQNALSVYRLIYTQLKIHYRTVVAGNAAIANMYGGKYELPRLHYATVTCERITKTC
jgi:hypothetical protein